MYALKIHKKALKFFQSRNVTEKKLIKLKLNLLSENPFSHPKLDIKKLKGIDDTLRLRIGKIRIIYQVVDEKLVTLIMSAGARGDIYKKK